MLIPYPLEPPPPLPPLDDPWEAAGADLSRGRRVECFWDLVKFHHGPVLRALDALGPLEVRDRRIVALEEPLFVWEVEAEGPLHLQAGIRFTERRIHYERSADGTSLWLCGEELGHELSVRCYGGEVAAVEHGDQVRLSARGDGRVRLVMVAAWSELDRDRTLRALARKGVAGVAAQQVRYHEQIAALGAKVTTPDSEENEEFELTKREFDALVCEHPDGHRALMGDPVNYGYALLSFGLRETVRDILRGPLYDPAACRLFAYYVRWVGVDEFVRRHWSRLVTAMREAEEDLADADEEDRLDHDPAAYELRPVAEAMGDWEASVLFGTAAARLDHVPNFGRDATLDTSIDRWGIVPNALEGAVRICPALPKVWPEMILERLRIGPTTLDLRIRRRPSGLAVRVKVTRGPGIVVQLAPKLDFTPVGVLVGEEPFPGPEVSLTVTDEVEATWHA